jgi:hypothetical protein
MVPAVVYVGCLVADEGAVEGSGFPDGGDEVPMVKAAAKDPEQEHLD